MSKKHDRLLERAARMYVMRRIRDFLKGHGIKQELGTKEYSLILRFCQLRNIPPPPTRPKPYWFMELRNNGSLNDIKVIPRGKRIRRERCSDEFYFQAVWRTLRASIFGVFGRKCMKCGSLKDIHCDHIVPRSLAPHLELEPSNMQVLCGFCNYEKSNKNQIDYRPVWAKTYDFSRMPIIQRPAITQKDVKHLDKLRTKRSRKSEKKGALIPHKKANAGVSTLPKKDQELQKKYDALRKSFNNLRLDNPGV